MVICTPCPICFTFIRTKLIFTLDSAWYTIKYLVTILTGKGSPLGSSFALCPFTQNLISTFHRAGMKQASISMIWSKTLTTVITGYLEIFNLTPLTTKVHTALGFSTGNREKVFTAPVTGTIKGDKQFFSGTRPAVSGLVRNKPIAFRASLFIEHIPFTRAGRTPSRISLEGFATVRTCLHRSVVFLISMMLSRNPDTFGQIAIPQLSEVVNQ